MLRLVKARVVKKRVMKETDEETGDVGTDTTPSWSGTARPQGRVQAQTKTCL